MENKYSIKCDFCGKTETCQSEYPEGCFLENQIEDYPKHLAGSYGRWLLKNAVGEDRGEGLCWYFERTAYNNKELFDLWFEKYKD